MRKFALTFSIAAATLLVTACGTPKEADNSANATEAIGPVADVNSTDSNATDTKVAVSDDSGNAVEDDDKGGDPGARK
jgi:hypothetical protein